MLPCQWLNDEIINFYGAMILERAQNNKENDKFLKVHYFSSFFWSKLKSAGYEKGRLAKWTKAVRVLSESGVCGLLKGLLQVDIFSKDVVLVPVNHNNAHWTAAAINFRRKRIESYDSMGMDRTRVYDVRKFN